MTVAPHVELTFNPTDLRPEDIPWTGRFLGTPVRRDPGRAVRRSGGR